METHASYKVTVAFLSFSPIVVHYGNTLIPKDVSRYQKSIKVNRTMLCHLEYTDNIENRLCPDHITCTCKVLYSSQKCTYIISQSTHVVKFTMLTLFLFIYPKVSMPISLSCYQYPISSIQYAPSLKEFV